VLGSSHNVAGSVGMMSVSGVDQLGELPLEQLVQTAARVARRELNARAKVAGPGAAMIGGGALLAALASGTGTAALILLLARRPASSAAALGVTGAYAGAGVLLARGGLAQLRQAAPSLSNQAVEDKPARNAKGDVGSAKRRAKSAAKSPRVRTVAKSKPKSMAAGSRRRASGTPTKRTRRRAS
jgi:Putative Actinobacterial Holin-X, holin superfamily III